jgi:hypothetical protein
MVSHQISANLTKREPINETACPVHMNANDRIEWFLLVRISLSMPLWTILLSPIYRIIIQVWKNSVLKVNANSHIRDSKQLPEFIFSLFIKKNIEVLLIKE